jgi:CheY-like chemotaxis protein
MTKGLLHRWIDRFQAAALARVMQGAGQLGFLDYRFDGDRMHWTRGLCLLFGLDEPPVGGLAGWLARMDPADRTRVERELWTACALRRRQETLDYTVDLPDGGRRLLSSRIMLSYRGDGRPVRMTGLATAVAPRAEPVALPSKDEQLALLSHQLRTPLGALSVANEVLQVVEPGSPDAREALAVIGRQTAKLSQLLHDVVRPAGDPPATAPLAPAGRPLPPARRRKVLVVENNMDALGSMCARLELEGHEVTGTRDGLDALCRLRSSAPEVSLVDLGLPRLTAYDLVRHARASGYSGRMVALCSVPGSGTAQHARRGGFDDWLVKPVAPDRLRASLAGA